MTEIKNTVVGSVKKPYVKPEIEVFDLDNQAPILVSSGDQSSGVGVGTSGLGNGGNL
mgnify:CR=1 FL=1